MNLDLLSDLYDQDLCWLSLNMTNSALLLGWICNKCWAWAEMFKVGLMLYVWVRNYET